MSSHRLVLLPALLALCASGKLFAADLQTPPAAETSATEPVAADIDPELKRLQERLQTLQTNNQIREAELQAALRETAEQRQRLEAELALQKQLLEKELAELTRQSQRLQAEQELKKQQSEAELQALRLAGEKDTLEVAKVQNEMQRLQLQSQQQQFDVQTKMAEIQLQQLQRNETLADMQVQLQSLNNELEVVKKQRELRDLVTEPVQTGAEPFKDGVLTISDRRVALNGPIISGTADYITRRIHFFNNQSEAPIFLMIDDCPGGSVMQGYRILKAMEASEAPIHVVVKSFAASMAAVITTDADHSYAYPNAIILHHQPWSGNIGNLAQQEEYLRVFKEWARRLHTNTADKMGLTVEKFYERMYAERVTGDWEEFADVAIKLNWVQHIVNEVREEGIIDRPTDDAPKPWYWWMQAKEQLDPEGRILLPPLAPYDFYFLHNPQGKRFSIPD